VQIPELLTQRIRLLTQLKFVSAECHAHPNAHKPPKTVALSRGSLGQSIGIDENNTFQLKFLLWIGIDESNTFQLKFLF